jgi:AraC family transcriptional regulator, regulatory protein of adaptative response / methylated-DNA-[protein]-cysteine methyltransferase
MLSFEVCNAARLRRDPIYDGHFFTAVKTTRIYCRPVCPVKQPLTSKLLSDRRRSRGRRLPAVPALPA